MNTSFRLNRILKKLALTISKFWFYFIDFYITFRKGNFAHYDFRKLHYIRHKIKVVSLLRVAALTCNITLYVLPPEIALNVPNNV